jgi:hypothetical protein
VGQMSVTVVGIEGPSFTIDGQLTYPGRCYRWQRVEGLLFNQRVVQGTFDDLNPETRGLWDYPDGPWDAERNTDEFVAAMPAWRAAGLLSFTLNLQGGNPRGYQRAQPWVNSAYTDEGELCPAYMARLARILDRADELGMAPILGLFYFGQDGTLRDEEAVIRATDEVTDWLLARGDRHVLIEIANEVDVPRYDHAILRPDRCHELIERVQARSTGRVESPAGRLLVSASTRGNALPPENVLAAADFLLLHGNGMPGPERIREMVRLCRELPAYRGQPILFNEDDHFDFEQADNHMLAALGEYAGWGYFDYRMEGEGYEEGYQSVPVDWSISSERKRGFFDLLAEVTLSETREA